jgi:hypothetical protein
MEPSVTQRSEWETADKGEGLERALEVASSDSTRRRPAILLRGKSTARNGCATGNSSELIGNEMGLEADGDGMSRPGE